MPFLADKPKEGYYRFVAMVKWEYGQDAEARKKLYSIFAKNLPLWEKDLIDRDSIRGYILTGERTMIIIGQTKSAAALQGFCASVSFESAMQVKFYHAAEVHELTEIAKTFTAPKAK